MKSTKVKQIGQKRLRTKIKKSDSNIKDNKLSKSKIKNKYTNDDNYVTDFNFIDVLEKEDKLRVEGNGETNVVGIKQSFDMKFIYRPSKNNLELIGKYFTIDNKKGTNNWYDCAYHLVQDKTVIANIDLSKINNEENQINNNNQIQKKNNQNKKNQSFYLHINKSNLVSCLSINEYPIKEYILSFLSGEYSGYVKELNRRRKIRAKTDNFMIFLYLRNDGIEVLGKGKNELGEYIIKGTMTLINNFLQYQELNLNTNNHKSLNKNNNNNEGTINFGKITFDKIYGI